MATVRAEVRTLDVVVSHLQRRTQPLYQVLVNLRENHLISVISKITHAFQLPQPANFERHG